MKWAVFVTWKELFDQSPTEDEVLAPIREFNRQSTVVLLSRIGIHLFLDRQRGNRADTLYLQGFLAANFWDDDVLDRAKQRMPRAQLDARPGFHPQQVLSLVKSVILHALPTGGREPDRDKEARFALGRCLLKTNDLLLSNQMAAEIARDRTHPRSPKNYLRLQLSVGAGNELVNPPPIPSGVVRNATIFEKIVKEIPIPVDLNRLLEQQAGISLDSYVDLTFGALAGYMGKTQKQFIDEPGQAVLNPKTFFGPSISAETAAKFWAMESSTLDEVAKTLSTPSDLIPEKDFTALRMKPFLELDSGNVICPNPGFIQEKLEIGLFWTIVNSSQGEDRKNAFDTWGKLFESYVNRAFGAMIDSAKEKYVPFPGFEEKKHHHEAFDGMLLSGRVCAAIECKGGFLPNSAKYADDLDRFVSSLDKKFGSEPGAGVEQLVRKISHVFAAKQAERRELEGVDLSSIDIVVPIMVVQDNFVSSIFVVPWLAKLFRDTIRMKPLVKKVVVTSLLVLHVEDVESIQAYSKTGQFSIGECLLYAGKCGDPGLTQATFDFSEVFARFLTERGIKPLQQGTDQKFEEILNRVTLRFFNKKFEPLPEEAGPVEKHPDDSP